MEPIKLTMIKKDKIIFLEENGKIVLTNPLYVALKELQEIMKRKLNPEEDVNDQTIALTP